MLLRRRFVRGQRSVVLTLRILPGPDGDLFERVLEEACVEGHRGAHDIVVSLRGDDIIVTSERGSRRLGSGV